MMMFKTTSEFDMAHYEGKCTNEPSLYSTDGLNVDAVPFTQEGTAFYLNTYPDLKLKNVELALKYTRIDPDYIAPASGVNDTTYQWIDTSGKVNIKNIASADDPTALYNNENKIEATAKVIIPYGMFVLNYGSSSQLRDTGSMFYAKHFILGDRMNDEIYSDCFPNAWGYLAGATGGAPADFPNEYMPFINYNINRYGFNPTLASNNYGYTNSIIAAGKGGLSTAFTNSNREYMVSSAVNGNTDKFYNDLVLDFRYELNKLVQYNRDVLFMVYSELTTLNNGTDFVVDYDPSKLLCQNITECTVIYNIVNSINLLGFGAVERWASNNVIPYGIDYVDTSYGAGFDYDFGSRASVYLRVKEFRHNDSEVPANDLNGWQVFAELKDFF
jgi:hypothetical protein